MFLIIRTAPRYPANFLPNDGRNGLFLPPAVFGRPLLLISRLSPSPSEFAASTQLEDASRAMSAPAKEVRKGKGGQKKSVHYPFWFGGSASCFAACVTHPLDLGEIKEPLVSVNVC